MVFEHVVFGEKGIPAITISAHDRKFETPIQKFSILDRDLCTTKLISTLDLLSESLLQTIVTSDVRSLNVPLLVDATGKATGQSD
jgi:hypothetical protein